MHRDEKWWTWQEGITDIRIRDRDFECRSAGTMMTRAMKNIRWVLARHLCEFKVGIASNLWLRWLTYINGHLRGSWVPERLFLLMETPDRDCACFAEAGLILACESLDYDMSLNINRRNRDLGGTGPRNADTMYCTHYVYLAVRAVDVQNAN